MDKAGIAHSLTVNKLDPSVSMNWFDEARKRQISGLCDAVGDLIRLIEHDQQLQKLVSGARDLHSRLLRIKEAYSGKTSLSDLVKDSNCSVEQINKDVDLLMRTITASAQSSSASVRPDAELDKFFSHQALDKGEMEKVAEWRQLCIQHVSKEARTYFDSFTKFSDTAIRFLADFSFHMAENDLEPSARTYDADYYRRLYETIFKSKTVIELGSGPFPINVVLNVIYWGADKYVGVDPFSPPIVENLLNKLNRPEDKRHIKPEEIESVKSDALDYLLKTRDSSAIVLSFGFLVLGEVIPRDKKGFDYLQFIVFEIARVTPPKGISFHSYCDFNFRNFMDEYFDVVRVESTSPNHRLWVKK